MKIQNKKTKIVLIAASFLSGLVLTSTIQADHNYTVLRARADAVFHSMVDLDGDLVESFHRSRVFGEIMAASGQIKAKALYLRGMAWSGSHCRWSRELERLSGLMHRLQSLLDTAYYRAERGLDPPISYCCNRARRRVAGLLERVRCMQAALYSEPVAPAWYRPGCQSGGGATPPWYHSGSNGYRGNGHGNRWNVQPGRGGLTIGNGNFGFNIRF